jgi:dihydrofolate reductase
MPGLDSGGRGFAARDPQFRLSTHPRARVIGRSHPAGKAGRAADRTKRGKGDVMNRVEIHGYAIVSEDDRIADASGSTPPALRNEADWAYFQAELDRAALTVLGRLGHEANPNAKGRRRLVLSRSAAGLERRADAWWWNPARLTWPEVTAEALPEGGRVAVPGGRQVFDLFLGLGYDAFHLTRAESVRVGEGIALFSACEAGESAESVLARHGLRAGERTVIDPAGPVSLTVWRR